jgi:peptidoglycan/LPS O-acetylase OafA/YrhL
MLMGWITVLCMIVFSSFASYAYKKGDLALAGACLAVAVGLAIVFAHFVWK